MAHNNQNTKIADFLAQNGWQGAIITPLIGDASQRHYYRLQHPNKATAILMDTPIGSYDNPSDFVKIAQHLKAIGICAPEIYAKNIAQGLLLLEDLGDLLFPKAISASPQSESDLYQGAVDVLLHIEKSPPALDIPDLSAHDWAVAASIVIDTYQSAIVAPKAVYSQASQTLTKLIEQALSQYANSPRIMILRDYHAENLLLLPHKLGIGRIGVLDFQLAQMGQPGYDLVSLLQDARRDVPQEIAQKMVMYYAAKRNQHIDEISPALAILGVQRALRIMGVFSSLAIKHQKKHYLQFLPRVWKQLNTNLAHPALHQLKQACLELLSPPTPENIKLIAQK